MTQHKKQDDEEKPVAHPKAKKGAGGLLAKFTELKTLLEEQKYFAAFRLALTLADELADLFGPEGQTPASAGPDDENQLAACAAELAECKQLCHRRWAAATSTAEPAGFNPAWIPLILQGVELLIELIRKRRGEI